MLRLSNLERWIIGLVTAAACIACGEDDELRAQLSALQTQVSQPTATATATATATRQPTRTPTPDPSDFCSAVGEYRDARQGMVDRFNEIIGSRERIDSFSRAEIDELDALGDEAYHTFVPLPPPDEAGHFNRMNVLVLAMKAEDDRLISAIRNEDFDAFASARQESNALATELGQLYLSVC